MGTRKTHRRDFLRGRTAAKALEDLLPPADSPRHVETAGHPPTPLADPAAESYLIHVGRKAMACQFEVLLNAGQHRFATEAALLALDLVDKLEDQLSVYRPHSEVSRLNLLAGDEAIVVEPRLFELLQQAVAIHRETEGAFDITSGPLTRTWGFYRRAGRLPTDEETAAALQRVGSQWLQLDEASTTVRFGKPGMEINLGAIGKGYALDRCAAVLEQHGVRDFLLHGGQSSIVARGSRLTAATAGSGWHVAIRHPLRPDQRLAQLWLTDQALGTSGSGQQFFHYQGRRFGHVLDPRTGMSVEGILSATVLAPTAALADALSTAFFVLGVERSLEFCRGCPELATVLVSSGQRAGQLALHTCGLREGQFESRL